ncbi:MAG: 2-amino-4-hydroxy-6-hydroxymethyldihydropteridine diphosphokinase [Granulosicoccus sp.]
MSRVFVALGSNLGDRESHVLQGILDIQQIPDCSNIVSSSIYETAPMGPQDQPDYLNSVCSFQCELEPAQLLAELKQIEKHHGRVQTTERWTARPLDLDILLFGDQQINTEELTIPHVGIAQRSFVLWPLAELDKTLNIPGLGPVSDLMDNCQRYGIQRYHRG